MYAANFSKQIAHLRLATPLERHAPAYSRKAIIVLGMHRSGTSAVTRVLSLCGAALPRHPMSKSHESNSAGHWEPLPIVDAHDRFLAASGRRWDDILEYPASMFRSDIAAAYEARLTKLALKEFGDSPLFILKDPRISRLMPLWRPVLDELDAAPHVVISIRNPLEVAASLERREGWDQYRAAMVWLRYMLAAERNTRDLPRCFIRYDRLIKDWRSTVARIENTIHVSLDSSDAAIGEQIDAFIKPEMRHHRHHTLELSARGDIADCVKQAYQCFCAAADGAAIDGNRLDKISASLRSAEQVFQNIVSSPDDLRRRPFVIQTAPPQPAKLDALVALLEAEVGKLQHSVKLQERELDNMLASRSWRITAFGRKISYYLGRLLAAT
jgi:hypothetical protein